MAAKVECVEGRSRPPQGVDGGRRRTRHPQITVINVGKQRQIKTSTGTGLKSGTGGVTIWNPEFLLIWPLCWKTLSSNSEKLLTAWKPIHSTQEAHALILI